jgi:hypothetical protein
MIVATSSGPSFLLALSVEFIREVCYSQAKDSEVVDGGIDGLHAPAGPAGEKRPLGAAAPALAAAAARR